MHHPITFTPIAEHHLSLLREWLARPHAAEWWSPLPSLEELHADYIAAEDGTRAYIATLEGEPIGFIQCYVVMGSGGGWWPDETDPGARGIDQFLCDPARLGQGLGRAMVRQFVDGLFEDPQVTVVQTDPSPDNLRAIRCYQHAGFSIEGDVMTPDGPAVLMRRRRTEPGGR
jgi:RimJ/RimL family protein N-acetyltransferase